jgi:hypothetical protein
MNHLCFSVEEESLAAHISSTREETGMQMVTLHSGSAMSEVLDALLLPCRIFILATSG